MPVRRLDQTVMTWPDAEEVHEAVTRWGEHVGAAGKEVRAIGYFGSYARGDWGVGSDLDVVVIVDSSDRPLERRALAYDALGLPVPVDLLVYPQAEWDVVRIEGMARAAREMVWVYNRDRLLRSS